MDQRPTNSSVNSPGQTAPTDDAEQSTSSTSSSTGSSTGSGGNRALVWLKDNTAGLVVCLAAAGVSYVIASFMSGVSALLIAILLGALWRNLAPVPAALDPGVKFSSKRLLRTGIVLLGFELSLSTVTDLGWGVIVAITAAVAITFFATLWIGHLLGISRAQRILIACGFSICGAAAVAGAEGAIGAKQHEVATALALVVFYGTLMIPLMPFLTSLLGFDQASAGMWTGLATHEVAQVVAIGGTIGETALAIAVTVKLARVVTLAPIIAGINVSNRRRGDIPEGKNPPIVPLFVAGFLAAMVIRTLGIVPDEVLAVIKVIESVLLAAAMFGLGLGVHLPTLFKVGGKPVVLGLISTLIILVVGLGGTLVFPPA